MAAEMRMIRWMNSHTKFNINKNVKVRENIRVAPVDDKIREVRLTWIAMLKAGL